eukprot:scaffold227036_cov20-Tisochrysis_lutea.AAC.1
MTCMHNVHIEGLHQRVWRLSRRLAGAVGILAALSLQSLPQINELHAAGSLRFTSWKRTARFVVSPVVAHWCSLDRGIVGPTYPTS